LSDLSALVRERIAGEGYAAEALAHLHRLVRFLELVLAANDEINLVSRASSAADELVERHLLDALFGLPLLPPPNGKKIRLLDVGSGGGFPAVPLLVVRPDLEGTLIDATAKKCRFLDAARKELDLTARVLNARFPAPQMETDAPFDLMTSRAVADAGGLVRDARKVLSKGARVLLWTSEPLLPEIRKRSGIQSLRFHRTPETQVRGVAVLECST
jgi:16S rRNA (guanine527-N7)-methyltransferase